MYFVLLSCAVHFLYYVADNVFMSVLCFQGSVLEKNHKVALWDCETVKLVHGCLSVNMEPWL